MIDYSGMVLVHFQAIQQLPRSKPGILRVTTKFILEVSGVTLAQPHFQRGILRKQNLVSPDEALESHHHHPYNAIRDSDLYLHNNA